MWGQLCAVLIAAQAASGAESSQVVHFFPETPHRGDTVTVVYDPQAEGAVLRDASSVTLVMCQTSFPSQYQHEMRRENSTWRAEVSLADSSISYLLFYFLADGQTDTNRDEYWEFFVHDDRGIPVRGAHVHRAYAIGFRSQRDPDFASMVINEYRAEVTLHPEDLHARMSQWELEVEQGADKDSLRQVMEGVLRERFGDGPYDGPVLGWFQRAYCAVKDDARAAEVLRRIIEQDPGSPQAAMERFNGANLEPDPARKVELLLGYLEDFPRGVNTARAYQGLFLCYADLDDSTGMAEWGEKWIRKESIQRAKAYNDVAWLLAEHGLHYEHALAHARTAVELADHDPVGIFGTTYDAARDSLIINDRNRQLMAPGALERELNVRRGMYRDTEGWILFTLGNLAAAESVLALAVKESDTVAHNRHLGAVYEAEGKADSAYAVYRRTADTWPDDVEAWKDFARVSIALHGGDDGLAEIRKQLDDKIAAGDRETYLADQRNEPMPAFECMGLDGSPIQSSDYAGKVLVLDFWATWCGPCLGALPFLQKAYERWKDDDRVAFLVLNTGGSIEPFERAKAFVEKRGYTFPVGYDKVGSILKDFGSQSIPLTVVADGEGRIRFYTSGFAGPDAIDRGLDLQIKSLLAE